MIEPTTEIPCDPTPRRLTVACGYRKQHRLEDVVDENGAPIDTGGEVLSFVVERSNGKDVETGLATMVEPGIFIFNVDLASQTPGEYRWAIRTDDRGAVVVYGGEGDYVVLDIAKDGDPPTIQPSQQLTSPDSISETRVYQGATWITDVLFVIDGRTQDITNYTLEARVYYPDGTLFVVVPNDSLARIDGVDGFRFMLTASQTGGIDFEERSCGATFLSLPFEIDATAIADDELTGHKAGQVARFAIGELRAFRRGAGE